MSAEPVRSVEWPRDAESLAGSAYDAAIAARESDRRARSAFRALVTAIAAPGASLYDFGAGTGIDARFYAERGYTVRAYDVDPRMCECFAIHCRELIDAGRVSLDTGPYGAFLAAGAPSGGRRADLIVSNFAPLNLIENLPELFARFHSLLAPGGAVLASVLSPYFIGDLRYRWWWRNLAALRRDGRYSVPGAQGPIVRRRLADFAAQCAPYFELERLHTGRARRDGTPAGRWVEVSRCARTAWLRASTCRFMFLLFRRQPDPLGSRAHAQVLPARARSSPDPSP